MKLIIFSFLFLLSFVIAQEDVPLRPIRPIRPPSSQPEQIPVIIPKSYFTVVAPYNIRPGYPYNIYVRGFSLVDPIRLAIKINGTRGDGRVLNIRKTAVVSRYSSKAAFSIDTSSIPKGNYELYVETTNFSERRSLTYVTKKFSFLIFMNKAIFRPGDLVQYKIFSINSETRSVDPKCSSIISITDGNGNTIATELNVTFSKGQYANEFQISSKAGLGNWRLQIQCDDEITSKGFEIAEYTLPLIQGSLSIAEVTPFSYGKVSITVDASYTFGGEVSGNATVSILKWGQAIMKREVLVTGGTATFDVDIVNDLQLQAGNYGYFEAYLVFNDPLTGNKVTDSKTFSVNPFLYNFEYVKYSVLKPGSAHVFKVVLKKFDGSPAPAGTKINVIPTSPTTIPSQTLILDDDGYATGSVDVPSNVSYISLRLTAKEASDGYIGASVYADIGENLRIEVLNERPKPFESINLRITSGVDISYVMLHVVSKGILLKSTRVWFDEDDPRTATYSFTPSLRYVPTTNVLVYYVNQKGNFITGQIDIQINNDLGNHVTITPSADTVKPGTEVDFEIESYVGSTVSLLALDQRVLLLKEGNNITKQNVFGAIQPYTYSNVNYDWGRIAGYEYTFVTNGLFIFTNIPRPRTYFRRPQRPEMADKEAKASRPDASSSNGVKIRKDFRETFLWQTVNIRNYKYENADEDSPDYWKGSEHVTEKVPESITKYMLFGVAMSKYDGMGLNEDISSVTIFLPFFLSVELPYNVKRNEVLVQDIIIFNYLKKGQRVEVRITKNPNYEAVDAATYGWKSITGFYARNMSTIAGKNIKLQFALRPKVLGFIPIEVTAKGTLAGDGLNKQLRVIPEGIPRYMTTSTFITINSTTSNTFNTTLRCNLPDSAYQDTTEISSTVVGDIFGKALNNLDNLIHMPGGCGEQTMLSLAPDIAIYQYLNASNKLTIDLKGKLQQYISAGYQNELRYQRYDGSFSAFGNSDPAGSTWLTAYVGLYFYFAKDMVTIDGNTIQRGADFVVSQQSKDGSFHEPGRVIHVDMQGGSGNGIGLTAYCVIFLSTILPGYSQYSAARDRAVTYLENSFSSSSTTYELGIIAYALKLAGSSQANAAHNLFDARRTENSLLLFWEMPAPPNPSFWYYYQARSLDIEISSYGLLGYIERGSSLSQLIKIVKYLVSKANNLGGYSSSQDTVMAFLALSKFARAFSLNTNIDLTMTPNVGSAFVAKVDSTNVFTLQSFELNPSVRKLDIKATISSNGLAIVSLVCNFYEDPTKVVPVFNVTYSMEPSCSYRIRFKACASYIPPGTSNMAIMMVTMPSGFVYNEWWGNSNPDVSKTEVTNQGSKVTFYFNKFSNTQSCVSVNAYRAQTVLELKGGTIQVFDYYDTSKEGSTAYPVPDLTSSCYYYRL